MSYELLGWFGTAVYLVNHALLSARRIRRGNVYFAGNAIAAAVIAVSSFALPSWQAVVVNGFWVVASVAGLLGASIAASVRPSARGLWLLCGAIAAIGLLLSVYDQYLAAATIGWSATLLFCGVYLLFAVGDLAQRSFLLCNAAAAFGLLPILTLDNNWPVVALEVAWGTLSLAGLLVKRPTS